MTNPSNIVKLPKRSQPERLAFLQETLQDIQSKLRWYADQTQRLQAARDQCTGLIDEVKTHD